MENFNLKGPGGPQQPGQPQMPPPPQGAMPPQAQPTPADAAVAKKGKKEKPPKQPKQPKEKKPRAPKVPKEPGAKDGKKPPIVLIALLVLALVGAGAYMFLFNKDSGGSAPAPATTRNTVPAPPGAKGGVPVPPGAADKGGVPVPPGAQPAGADKTAQKPGTPPPPEAAKKAPAEKEKDIALITNEKLNEKSASKRVSVDKKPAAKKAEAPAAEEKPAAKKEAKPKKKAAPAVKIVDNKEDTYKLSYAPSRKASRKSSSRKSRGRKSSSPSYSYSYEAPQPMASFKKAPAPKFRQSSSGMPVSEFRASAPAGELPIRGTGYAPPINLASGRGSSVDLYSWSSGKRGKAYISPDEFSGPGRPSAPGGGLSRVHEYHRVVVLDSGNAYQVQRAKDLLTRRNLIPEVRSFESGGDVYYEVSIGHYTDKNMALNKANEVAGEGFSPRVVTEKLYQ